MRRLLPLLRLLRPGQWIKNALVPLPLVFAGLLRQPGAAMAALGATLLFCAASSACYVMNDLHDLEADRRHPVKRLERPLASGSVTRAQAKWLLLPLYGLTALGAWWQPALGVVLVSYLLLNLGYARVWKHRPIVDLFVLATGFVLRVLGGAVVIGTMLSAWMGTTVLCLALFLAALKRLQELRRHGAASRPVLNHYSEALLLRYAELSAGTALLCYALFALTARPALAPTLPIVMAGLFRCWYVVEIKGKGESPSELPWRDAPLALLSLGWLMLCMLLLDRG